MNKLLLSSLVIALLLFVFGHFFDLLHSLYWQYIDAFATTLTLYLVWEDYLMRKNENDKINIFFELAPDKKKVQLQPSIVRKFFSRQELQGILANHLNKGVTRYDIKYLASEEYFQNIYEIQTGDKTELIIHLESDEIEQFSEFIEKHISNEPPKTTLPDLQQNPQKKEKHGIY